MLMLRSKVAYTIVHSPFHCLSDFTYRSMGWKLELVVCYMSLERREKEGHLDSQFWERK